MEKVSKCILYVKEYAWTFLRQINNVNRNLFSLVKMSTLTKAIYTFNGISIKIPPAFSQSQNKQT